MSASNHKVGSPITVWQNLGNVFINQANNLKAWWDQVGEIVRLKHDDLCDYIDTDIATKSELQGVILGQIADGSITLSKIESAFQTLINQGVNPAGSIIAMASSNVPTGYLECDGSVVSRTTYANLFTAIGTTYGPGDGSTTFRLPDLRGEFLRGWDHGKGTDVGRQIGTSQASTSFTLSYGSYAGFIENGENPRATSAQQGGADTTSATRYDIKPRNVSVMYCIKH